MKYPPELRARFNFLLPPLPKDYGYCRNSQTYVYFVYTVAPQKGEGAETNSCYTHDGYKYEDNHSKL
jgi:hypothetical protein